MIAAGGVFRRDACADLELTLGDSLETTTLAGEPLAGLARKLAADAVPSKRDGDLVFFVLAVALVLKTACCSGAFAALVRAPLACPVAKRFFFAVVESDTTNDAALFRLVAVVVFLGSFFPLAPWRFAPRSDVWTALAVGRFRPRGVATPVAFLADLPRAAFFFSDADRTRLAGVFLLDFLRPPLDVALLSDLCRRLVRLAAPAALFICASSSSLSESCPYKRLASSNELADWRRVRSTIESTTPNAG